MKTNTKWFISKSDQNKLKKALTENLRILRAKIGISQIELSKLLGISRQTYSSIECGRKEMSWSNYLSLILFFDHNSATHEDIRLIKAYPNKLFLGFNDGKSNGYETKNSFEGISDFVISKLDPEAISSIKTHIMDEYIRCANLSVNEIIKA